jgi:hypothetical protein
MSKSFTTKKKQTTEILTSKDVKYPLLFTASQTCSDVYWKAVLLDMSKGKCPKKVQIDGATIIFGNKRNLQTYKYGEKSPEEIATDCQELFKKYLGIYSITDFKTQSEDINNQFEHFNQVTDQNEWKKIKNKKMKENLLWDFIISKKIEHNLSLDITRSLALKIENAFFNLRTHGSDDVFMSDGQVTEINDIIIRKHEIINPRIDFLDETPEKVSGTQKNVKDKWASYIKGLVDDCR